MELTGELYQQGVWAVTEIDDKIAKLKKKKENLLDIDNQIDILQQRFLSVFL